MLHAATIIHFNSLIYVLDNSNKQGQLQPSTKTAVHCKNIIKSANDVRDQEITLKTIETQSKCTE
jgi:hypothetical protein